MAYEPLIPYRLA